MAEEKRSSIENLKRKKTWLDKLCKGKRKATKPIVSTKKRANVGSNIDIRKKKMYNLK
jgi:hypothetical protein